MTTKPETFIDIAEHCHQLKTEFGYRNSVARSYYGMYHQVIDTLKEQPFQKEGAGCHSSLIQYLQNPSPDEECDKTKLRRIGIMLKAGKDNRVKADYKLNLDIFTECFSSDSIAAARRLQVLCEETKV